MVAKLPPVVAVDILAFLYESLAGYGQPLGCDALHFIKRQHQVTVHEHSIAARRHRHYAARGGCSGGAHGRAGVWRPSHLTVAVPYKFPSGATDA